MTAILRTLEHLDYVNQCLAGNLLGEAKSEIENLATLLERDIRFAFSGSAQAASELRKVVLDMRDGGEKFHDGKGRLFGLSNRLWREVLPPPPPDESLGA